MTPGWHIQAPGPDEAGPSNWVECHAAAAVEAQGLGLYQAENYHVSDNFVENPPDLQNVSHLVNDRFRISPPVFADIFDPMLQEQLGDTKAQENSNDALYSPTSPLQLDFLASVSDESSTAEAMVTSQHQQIVLGFQCQSVFFSRKSRRNGVLKRNRSAGSTFLFTGNEEQVRRAKRKNKI